MLESPMTRDPEKRREEFHRWYVNNREKNLEKQRKWRAEHPDLYWASVRKSREKHRDVINAKARERSRQWRKDNPDRVREQSREAFSRNPEKIRAKVLAAYYKRRATVPETLRENQRKWRAANPDAVRADNARRRRRDSGAYTPADVQRLFGAQDGECAACHTPLKTTGADKYHVDHIVPLKPRKGFPAGTNDPANLQLLCMPCNRSKGNLPPEQWAEKLKRRSA
jgi:5-methylcytosine-specific restriction endonuclease McrA